MSKYLKSGSLSNPTDVQPIDVAHAQQQTSTSVNAEGYTSDDVSLFNNLMSFPNCSSSQSVSSKKTPKANPAQFTEQDIECFSRLMPGLADSNESAPSTDAT